MFGGRLHLDKMTAAGEDHVHINVGAGILFVAEVEHGDATDDTDAGGGDVISQRQLLDRLELNQLFERDGERHKRAGDGGGARAAIGLEDVAIEDHSALSESLLIDDGAQSPPHQALNLVRPARRTALVDLARRALAGGAGQHGIFSRDPTLAGVAQERGHGFLHAGGAEHLGIADLDQRGSFRGSQKARHEFHGAHVGGLAFIRSHFASRST
jgi:hypothetical protein